MTRTIAVVGIGAGDPAPPSRGAVRAIGSTDVFFVIDKGAEKDDLTALRHLLLHRHAAPGHRVVEIADPPRDRDADAYTDAVDDWRRRRAARLVVAIRDHLADGQR